jgi:hypothetical protein
VQQAGGHDRAPLAWLAAYPGRVWARAEHTTGGYTSQVAPPFVESGNSYKRYE